jgi:CHAT domain-containing protein
VGQFEKISEILNCANTAIKSGQLPQARIALEEVKPILWARIEEGSSFSAVVTIQATLMSLMVHDENLAQEFATMVMSEVTNMLQSLHSIYQRELNEGKLEGFRNTLDAANVYVLAFIPYVSKHPCFTLEEAKDFRDAASAISSVIYHIRPKLDFAGWAFWSYPPELEHKAKYWSARALTDFGQLMVLPNIRSGQDVRNLEDLAEISLKLLEGQLHDELAADTYNLLGVTFCKYDLVETMQEKAIPCFKQSIDILDAIGNHDDAAIDRENLACNYIELGDFALANGNPAAANEYYHNAEKNLTTSLTVHRTCKIVGHLPRTLANLGSFYLAQEKWNEAKEMYAEALDVFSKGPLKDASLEIIILSSMGYALYKQDIPKQLVKAEEYLRLAVASIEKPKTPPPEPLIYILAYANLGDLLRRQGKANEGYSFLLKAFERLESYRSSFTYERSRGSLVKNYRWVYEAMIDCCARLGNERASQAFNLVETVKWHSLTAILRYQDLRLSDVQQDEPLLQEERGLLKQICNISIGRPTQITEHVDMEAINRRLEEIWTEIEPTHPEYVAIRKQKAIEAHDVVELLDKQVPVLVEYYLGDQFGTSIALVLRKDEEGTWPKLVQLETSLQDFLGLIRELRPQDHKIPSLDLESFNRISKDLYHKLFEPLLPYIKEGEGICIVPYGILHNIPFGALYDGHQYLIQRNPVVIMPSSTALRWWVRKDRRASQSCLIFPATGIMEKGMRSLDLLTELAKDKLVPLFGSNSKFIEPKEATKQKLLQELSSQEYEWNVVYIACHGFFEKKDPLRSYLVMAGNPEDQDKNLSALDIFTEVHSDATLITLSACDSGIAETSTNDEMAGLAHAFLFGGASSVIASLWLVRQGVTVDITRRFYELWKGDVGKEQLSKIKSLQLAEQEELQKEDKPHPQLWAAFQLYGDWR